MSGVGLTGLIKDLPGTVTPYPVWEDVDGLGGWSARPSIAARNAIPANFRKIGMVVVDQSTGIPWELVGGITNADWQELSSASIAALTKVAYVDHASVVPTPNGSIAAPYPTLQAAVTALTVGGVLLIAPGTYPEALTIPAGLEFTFAAIGFAGLLQIFVTGVVTWNMSNGGEVSWSGIDLRQVDGTTGPIFSDADAGVGRVHWNLFNCIQGIQTHDGSARTHDVAMRAGALPVNGLDVDEPVNAPVQLMGFDVSGQVQVSGGSLAGSGPFKCQFIRLRDDSAGATGITIQVSAAGSTFEQSSFGTGITLQTGALGATTFDLASFAQWATSNSVFTGSGANVVLLNYNQPVETNTSNAAGAALTLDFSASHGVSQKFTLSAASCTLTVVDPLVSCLVFTRVVQGAGNQVVVWPARFVNPPPLNLAAAASTETLWYYNATAATYFSVQMGTSSSTLNVTSINTGNLGGTKLVAIDTTQLATGTLATVNSVGANFSLVTNAAAALLAAVDGITIVQSTAVTTSVWVRLVGGANPKFGTTPPLFIDPAGNDDNDGLLVGTPLKTADEWSRRMNSQVILADINVTCAAGTIGNFAIKQLSNVSAGSAFIFITGASTLSVAVGTVSSITAENSATGQEFIFLDSSGIGPAISDGDRLQIVSSAIPANVGGVGYVKGFGAGGATNPYTSTWMNPAAAPFFPAAGDTYVISTPTSILTSVSVNFFDLAKSAGVGGIAFVNFNLQSNRVPGYALFFNYIEGNGNFGSYFQNCVFNDSFTTNFQNCMLRCYGCDFKTAVVVDFNSEVTFHGCIFRSGGLTVSSGGIVNTSGGTCDFDGGSTSINIAGTGSFVTSSEICISRATAIATGAILIQGQKGNFLPVFNVWGPPLGARNNATFGVQLFAGGTINANFFALLLLAGTTANVAAQSIPILQNTVLEANQSGVCDLSLGAGAVMQLRDLFPTDGGFIPTASPGNGTMRYGWTGSQYARGHLGALTTVVPQGGAAANHAAISRGEFEGGPTNTVGAATSTIFTLGTTAPGISGAINNAAIYAEASFAGFDVTDGTAVTVKVARAFRVVAGVLTALGGATTILVGPLGDAALLTAAGLLTASGTNILAQVTGVATFTIAWNVTLTIKTSDFVG